MLKIVGLGLVVSVLLVTTTLTARILCSPEAFLLRLIWRALITS